MGLPINIKELIQGTIVEYDRVEFKEGWNPKDVMQTMCAFANDFNNLGGGYIIIGIKEKNGKPILPPAGVDSNKIDSYLKELNELSNKINPTYFGIASPENLEKKLILVIWCPGGDNRPYDAPNGLGKSGTKSRSNWIRPYSSTIKARSTQKTQLFEMAASIPFDDQVNHQSEISDLDKTLILEFLENTRSELATEASDMDLLSVGRKMQIIKGPAEKYFPTNVGLLLFNKFPHQYFCGAKIEVILYKDDSGSSFSEKIFEGPVHKQLIGALEYIKTVVIREEVRKIEGVAESKRFYNYPYDAIEEVLANAVYHRGYNVDNTIEVNVRPDKIEVVSYPGPLPPLNNSNLNKKNVVARNYRNRRIGDFLKELHLTEGWGTGFPKIHNAMKQNGSPPPHFETDENRTYFLATLKVHQESITFSQPDPLIKEASEFSILLEELGTKLSQVCPKSVPSHLAALIIINLEEEQNNQEPITELMDWVNESNRTRFRQNILKPMMDAELVEFTMPDKPTSSKQKYRLTDKAHDMYATVYEQVQKILKG